MADTAIDRDLEHSSRGHNHLRRILHRPLLSVAVVLGLCTPLALLGTEQDSANTLILTYRWDLVAVLLGLAFVGSLAAGWFTRDPKRPAVIQQPKTNSRRVVASVGHLLSFGAVSLPLIASLMTGGLDSSRYWIDLGTLMLIYVMLGWGLNIVVGLAGLLDLGYVAFYAVGAYTYALLSTTFGVSFWLCLPIGGTLAAIFGIVLGFPVLRLRGDYLAVVTLAFGEIVRLVLINWVDVTGGSSGVANIPQVTFFGLPFTRGTEGFANFFGLEFSTMHRIVFLYCLILVLAFMTNLVTFRLRKLPIGRAWEALREDEIACQALGLNTTNTKLAAFAIGAMFAGLAGTFFAARQSFVSPESFNFLESAIILSIVVLGGRGSQLGVAIAAIVLVGAPELLRNLDFLKSFFGPSFDPSEYRLLIFGAAMVLMMIFRPLGLIGKRSSTLTANGSNKTMLKLVDPGRGHAS